MVTTLKNRVRSLSHSRIFSACVTGLERLGGTRENLLPVLTYHRVANPQDLPFLYNNAISATPSAFDFQIQQLVRRFRIVGMEQVLEAVRSGTPLPSRSLLLTFDDAYRDFHDHAWPVLRRHGLPVTLFVPTAYPDNPHQPFWWDRLANAIYHWPTGRTFDTPVGRWRLETGSERQAALRATRDYVKSLAHAEALGLVDEVCRLATTSLDDNYVLSWDTLRQLAADGVTLGAHTQTHPMLNRVTPEVARREAVESLADLRRHVGQTPKIFAYPSGGLNDAVVENLRGEFELAFTTCRGVNDLRDFDALRLRRINIGRDTAHAMVRAQLLPASRWLNAYWPV